MTDTALPTTDGWRATYLAHQPVVDVNGGESLGEVADLVFDPTTSTIAGLLVSANGRNGSLLEAARRAFGGSIGLTYIALDHIIALNSDVVTIDQGENQSTAPRDPLPRLSAVLKFDVITIRGKRLGQLEDLLLDPDGRRIVGYLVAQPVAPARASDEATPASPQPEAGDLPETVRVEPATTLASPSAPSTPHFIVVASDQGVRVGRDLIIVAGATTGDRSLGTPFALRRASQSAASVAAGQPGAGLVADTGWQVYEPDAPTQEIHR